MVKTTVYLPDSDALALRRIAAETGRSQAEIIRDAIAKVTARAPRRELRAAGAARGDGSVTGRTAEAVLERELGQAT